MLHDHEKGNFIGGNYLGDTLQRQYIGNKIFLFCINVKVNVMNPVIMHNCRYYYAESTLTFARLVNIIELFTSISEFWQTSNMNWFT